MHPIITLYTEHPKILISSQHNQILLLLNEVKDTVSLCKIIDAFSTTEDKEDNQIQIKNVLTKEKWMIKTSLITKARTQLQHILTDQSYLQGELYYQIDQFKQEYSEANESQSSMNLSGEKYNHQKEISFQSLKTKFNQEFFNKQLTLRILKGVKMIHQRLSKSKFKSLIQLKTKYISEHKIQITMQKGKKLKNIEFSKHNILLLMYSIAKGIDQLQKTNICNLDISFDNLIAIYKYGKVSFYLIDFDYCFCTDIKPVCQEMKDIIQYIDMIESAQDLKRFLQILFRGIKQPKLQQIQLCLLEMKQDKGLRQEFICNQLTQYTQEQNRAKYIDMLNELILSKQVFKQQDENKLSNLLKSIEQLKMPFNQICSILKSKFLNQISQQQS